MADSIRIVSVPPGDAPLWVREKWLGLVLPLASGKTKARFLTVSVNVKATFWEHLWAMIFGRSKRVEGYSVEAARAVDILATSSQDAAQWWQQNTPDLLRHGRRFVFHAEACELV